MTEKNDFKLDVVSIRLVKEAPIYSEQSFNKPEEVAAVMGECMCQFDREVVCVVNLSSDLKPINVHFASVGSLNEAMAHPRELFNNKRESGGAIMAEEIQEAVQIIRVAYDGIEIAMKVGSGGIAAMQKAIDFLKGMLDYEKSLGKTSMRKLLLKGGDLQVLQFKTEDMRKVERMAKKYGIRIIEGGIYG